MKLVYCRRCCKKHKPIPGRNVIIRIHSKYYGFGEIKLENPLCKRCIEEIKMFWEARY